LDYTY